MISLDLIKTHFLFVVWLKFFLQELLDGQNTALHFKKDIEMLRHVQKKAASEVKCLETKSYKRLRDPGFSLGKRWLKGELLTL